MSLKVSSIALRTTATNDGTPTLPVVLRVVPTRGSGKIEIEYDAATGELTSLKLESGVQGTISDLLASTEAFRVDDDTHLTLPTSWPTDALLSSDALAALHAEGHRRWLTIDVDEALLEWEVAARWQDLGLAVTWERPGGRWVRRLGPDRDLVAAAFARLERLAREDDDLDLQALLHNLAESVRGSDSTAGDVGAGFIGAAGAIRERLARRDRTEAWAHRYRNQGSLTWDPSPLGIEARLFDGRMPPRRLSDPDQDGAELVILPLLFRTEISGIPDLDAVFDVESDPADAKRRPLRRHMPLVPDWTGSFVYARVPEGGEFRGVALKDAGIRAGRFSPSNERVGAIARLAEEALDAVVGPNPRDGESAGLATLALVARSLEMSPRDRSRLGTVRAAPGGPHWEVAPEVTGVRLEFVRIKGGSFGAVASEEGLSDCIRTEEPELMVGWLRRLVGEGAERMVLAESAGTRLGAAYAGDGNGPGASISLRSWQDVRLSPEDPALLAALRTLSCLRTLRVDIPWESVMVTGAPGVRVGSRRVWAAGIVAMEAAAYAVAHPVVPSGWSLADLGFHALNSSDLKRIQSPSADPPDPLATLVWRLGREGTARERVMRSIPRPKEPEARRPNREQLTHAGGDRRALRAALFVDPLGLPHYLGDTRTSLPRVAADTAGLAISVSLSSLDENPPVVAHVQVEGALAAVVDVVPRRSQELGECLLVPWSAFDREGEVTISVQQSRLVTLELGGRLEANRQPNALPARLDDLLRAAPEYKQLVRSEMP